MKQKQIAILSVAAVIASLVIGGTIMTLQNKNLFTHGTKQGKKEEQDPREQQLAYLKKHEEEIKEFVKSQNSKIETVQIDWNETMWEEVGYGTPQGGGEVVIVGGGFNNIEGSTWQVLVRIKNEKIVFVFSATWCPDCIMLDRYLEDTMNKFPEIKFVYVNRDDFTEIAQALDIFGIPSFVGYKNNVEVSRFVSRLAKTQKEVEQFLEKI